MPVYDFTKIAYKNDTFRLQVELKQPNGCPVDLTGALVRFSVSTVTQDTPGVQICTDGANGKFEIVIPADVMYALNTGRYSCGVQITYADVTKETILYYEVDLRDGVAP